jgi:hypothetical protein
LEKPDPFLVLASRRFASLVIILPDKYYLSLPADIGEPFSFWGRKEVTKSNTISFRTGHESTEGE